VLVFAGPRGAAAGWASPGRVCHSVLVFISTCSITAVVVCVFSHVQWRFVLNDRPARGPGWAVKLTDYGLTKGGSVYYGESRELPLLWMPPEVRQTQSWPRSWANFSLL
jgi:hypothetical protein